MSETPFHEIENLKKKILQDYPRLDKKSEFSFECHPSVSCFNDCCSDINIFLTPYDIIRLRSNLKITSGQFLSDYTISPFDENLKHPVVLLKMEENEKKTCPFVGRDGCKVYHDRPWACRMFPLGMASPKDGSQEADEEFYFLLKESFCKGFQEKRKYTVSDWLDDQGITEYNEVGEHFKELTLHKFFLEGQNLPPQKVEMFFMVCYDIDKFRDFLFGTTFFDKFEVDEATRKKIEEDDVELLKFGFKWLRFSLFGEKTFNVKGDVLDAKKQEIARQKKQ